MPRRSSRAVPVSAAAPAPVQKRRASDRLPTASKTGSKRQKSDVTTTTTGRPVRSTSKKSKYFQEEYSDDSGTDSNNGSPPEDSPSNYDDSASSVAESVAFPTASEATENPRKKPGRPRKSLGSNKGDTEGTRKKSDSVPKGDTNEALNDKQLWKEGVKAGLGPGKEVFIKKPKARDAGTVPYQEHTLHPNTFLFLVDLAENNERAWLKAHDPDYRASKKDWESFVASLTEKISEMDSTIPELPVKDLVFRIHRDIRFSKNPTPYKTHFSAAWSRTGKKGPYAAYYVHCQPKSCFVGSGLWHPEADKLALMREDIDRNSHRLKAVLGEEGMRRELFDGVSDEEKAVEAFVNQNQESALKTKPKGYGLDNENIRLLRLRSFTIGRPLADEELMSPNAQDKIAALIGIMEPFVTYLNSVVMPDPEDMDASSGSESTD
ncbi:hypothetical protein F9C07_2234498 [Aspergillus flavus]|uniref:TIGR02453 family protein n=2 Tax=Aspergillus flavus TaxID=5059 RepID=A0A7U2MIU7_ASPFN|nr:hypothetical protein AFLA_009337 [Aspergillus flavus NRRL3357]QRD84544.1 hypothetical protein F9C07_2234498 [Aspergillus flavus]RAQ74120.1 hypothetical protein COH21_000326 [Aspergillus flavus]RAQ75958.1 hypothetical protein COH20_001763 [Aspergillus flavus]RMZ36359.1 hypothetical protein CA14_005745 [Aspergillus flavus]